LKETILESCGDDLAGIEFELSVVGLGIYRWSLEQATREFNLDWTKQEWSDNEGVRLEGSLQVSGESPLKFSSSLGAATPPSGIALILPDIEDDRALLCGVVTSPSVLRIGDRDRREFIQASRAFDEFQDRPGLSTLGVSYLAWRTARPLNIFAEWERNSICAALEAALVQQFCGASWRAIEADGGGLTGNAHDALVRICLSRGIASGKRFPELEPREKTGLRKKILDRLLQLAPDLSALMSAESFEQLDYAIMETYEEINKDRAAADKPIFDEPDIFNEDATWRGAIEQALKDALIPAFQPLLLPRSRWLSLSSVDYRNSGMDDVVQALWSSHVDASRTSGNRWLSRRELLTGLQLWVSPRSLLATSGWRADLSKLLSDRQTSRAIRYAALRLRAETQNETN
jgi:hypothetical protein